jgi:hypothetical protein
MAGMAFSLVVIGLLYAVDQSGEAPILPGNLDPTHIH